MSAPETTEEQTEETPLIKKDKKTAKQNWAKVKAATHAIGSVSRMQQLRNKAQEVHQLSMQSTASNLVHNEGEEPSPEDIEKAKKLFMMMFFPLFCCLGMVIFIVGSLAVYFAIMYPSGEMCPFPLHKFLLAMGIGVLLQSFIICATPFAPQLQVMAQYLLSPCVQILQLVVLILTLCAYSKAGECGRMSWWASLFFACPPIAACVCCCCNPFGAAAGSAKAALLAAHVTAPAVSVKAKATTATATGFMRV
jgi:magnesium-transporting ATPase (P-type)